MRSTEGPGDRLILGLGNPGPKYRESRHNLGFRVVEELARRRGIRIARLECNALVGSSAGTMLAMPQTYMNRSGFAARCLLERHGFEAASVLVAYDDLNLELGRLRLRPKGGPGGHRGMESVLENLRTEAVPRLRLGIGRPAEVGEDDQVDFVLSPFRRDELETVAELVERAADACGCWLEEGAEAAMNRFNS